MKEFNSTAIQHHLCSADVDIADLNDGFLVFGAWVEPAHPNPKLGILCRI